MRSLSIPAITLALAAAALLSAHTAGSSARTAANAHWPHGLPTASSYFPIAVWLQDPANATRFRQAGINLYVGLWKGPTEAQLAALKAAGMLSLIHI